MSVTLTTPPAAGAARETRTTWTRVTDGLWTASADGMFLGTVEAEPGDRFLAVDSRGRTVGEYGDLLDAQQVLDQPEAAESVKADRRERRLAAATAIVAAATSAGILVMVALDVLR